MTPALAQERRRLAAAAFRAVEAAGLAHVDCCVDRQTGTPYVSETNTLSGLTTTSMSPKLWEASGVPYRPRLDHVVQLALAWHQDRQRSRIAHDTRPLPPGS